MKGKIFMEMLFNARTSVVSFEHGYGQNNWIVLPMMAYKILVPFPEKKEFNLFQEIILKFYRRGKVNGNDIEKIADKLLLHVSLVEYIVNQLKEAGYIKNGNITEKGEKALKSNENIYEMKTGYIFFDIISQKFWDVFIFDESLKVVDSEHCGKYKQFYIGSDTNEVSIQALIIQAVDYVYPNEIDGMDALKICLKYRNRLKFSSRNKRMYSPDEEVLLNGNVAKVKLIEDAPKPFYVTTRLFIDDDFNENLRWHVNHPFFDKEKSYYLRESLEKVKNIDENINLKKLIISINNAHATSQQEKKDIAKTKNNEYIVAKSSVIDTFGSEIAEYQILLNLLSVMEEKYKYLSSNKSIRMKERGIWKRTLSDYVIKCYEVFEELLWIISKQSLERIKGNFSKYTPNSYLSDSCIENVHVIDRMTKKIGFENQFNMFSKISSYSVDNSLVEKELVGLLALNILLANDDQQHSFYNLVGNNMKNFIVSINDLRRYRNICMHKFKIRFDFEEVSQFRNFVYVVVSLTLFNKKCIKYNEYKEESLAAIKEEKLLFEYEQEIRAFFGVEINKFKEVLDALVATKYSEDYNVNRFPSACSTVMEDLFSKLISKVSISDYYENYVQYIEGFNSVKLAFIDICRKLEKHGFIFDLECIDKSIETLNKNKMYRSLKYIDKSVFSVKFLFVFYIASVNDKYCFLKLANKYPKIIEFVIGVNGVRGHSTVSDRNSEMTISYSEIQECTKAILEII